MRGGACLVLACILLAGSGYGCAGGGGAGSMGGCEDPWGRGSPLPRGRGGWSPQVGQGRGRDDAERDGGGRLGCCSSLARVVGGLEEERPFLRWGGRAMGLGRWGWGAAARHPRPMPLRGGFRNMFGEEQCTNSSRGDADQARNKAFRKEFEAKERRCGPSPTLELLHTNPRLIHTTEPYLHPFPPPSPECGHCTLKTCSLCIFPA